MDYEKILRIMKEKKISNQALSNLSGVPLGTLNKILYGITKEPSVNAIQNIANALGYTLNDFVSDQPDYYLDSEVAEKAQEIYADSETRILLDAKRDLSKEDLTSVLNIVRSLKAKEK